MSEHYVEALKSLGAIFSAGISLGAGLTIGAMCVCKLFKWAPTNITVIVRGKDGE